MATIATGVVTLAAAAALHYSSHNRVRSVFAAAGLVLASFAGSAHAQEVLPAPSIGGSAAGFEAVLGGPNDASIGAYLHFQRCAGTDVDQFVLMAPSDQVWTIQRAWCDQNMRSADDRFADAAQYVPADAVPGAPFTDDMGETGQTYVSATLASELPASLFH